MESIGRHLICVYLYLIHIYTSEIYCTGNITILDKLKKIK